MDYEKIRKLIIISLFVDDTLFERFVLKGGNALLVYDMNTRASMDIDISIEDKFDHEEELWVEETLKRTLNETFLRENYAIIDCKLTKTPKSMSPEKEKFWGGYKLEFKIVPKEKLGLFVKNIITEQQLRQFSIGVDQVTSQSKTFKVDISNYEYCGMKEEKEIDGFPIHVYTPIAIIYEKLRAICQQQKEYEDFVKTNRRPRPRDFFDICSILENRKIFDPDISKEIYEEKNLKDMANIFSLKKVPLRFLLNIKKYKDYHEEEFGSVIEAVDQTKTRVESFDFYFYTIVRIAEKLADELNRLNMLDNISSNE